MGLQSKFEKLKELIKQYESVVIAYSGGVDSTFLAKVSTDILGNKALCVSAVSDTYTPKELEDSKCLAAKLKLNHRIIETNELADEAFASNPPDRCYYCKLELATRLTQIAASEGYNFVLDGSNQDDLSDFRPGAKAAQEKGIKSPLQEVGLTKSEIRELSREMGLSTWNKPSAACLASRIPYRTRITTHNLQRVYQSEQFLQSLGYSPVRVRDYNHTARIEISLDQFNKAITSDRTLITEKLQELGYIYVTLDLEGLVSGSMNKVLDKE